jgi:hypothetical protein
MSGQGCIKGFEVHGAAAGYALQDRNPNTPVRWSMFATGGALGFYGAGSTRMTVDATGKVTARIFDPPSDRNLKENFQPVDARVVLAKVAALPLSEWNFKEDTAARHVGPVAQDFHAAFGLGTDDKHIATVDADGVALSAIQGLNQKPESVTAALRADARAKDAELQELRRQFIELKELFGAMAGPKGGAR